MRYIICLWLILGLPITVLSQKPVVAYTISGRIADSASGKPLDRASVYFFEAAGGRPLGSVLTNAEGQYFFSLTNRPEILVVQYIGYTDRKMAIAWNAVSRTTVDLLMQSDNALLKDVTVNAAKKALEPVMGGYVFNMQASNASKSTNLSEFMPLVPGLSIDAGGNLKLRGNNVRIKIDGRDLNLSGELLNNYLKSINSEKVKEIVVITDPTAQFEASSGGIIDIHMKARPVAGFNGNLGVGYTTLPGTSLSTNLFYNTPKMLFFFNGNLLFSSFRTNSDNFARYAIPSSFSTRMNSMLNRKSEGNGAEFGFDYLVDSLRSVSLNLSRNQYHSSSPVENRAEVYSASGQSDSSYVQSVQNLLNTKSYTGQVTYTRHYAKSPDRLFTAMVNASVYDNHFDNNFQRHFYAAGGAPKPGYTDQQGNTQFNNNVWTAKLDYATPLKKIGLLMIGFRDQYSNLENIYAVYDYDPATLQYKPNSILTNSMTYSENVAAAYLSLRGPIRKWRYEIGMRGEHTTTDLTTMIPSVRNFSRSYFNLFPNVNVRRGLPAAQSVSFSFGKSIARPEYVLLNPFVDNSNPFENTTGNPLLNPFYPYRFSAAYNKGWKNSSSLSVNLFASISDNIYGRVIVNDGSGKPIRTYVNYQKSSGYGVNVSLTNKIAAWWDLNTNLLGRRLSYDAGANVSVEPAVFTCSVSMSNSFAFKHQFYVQLTANYNSPSSSFQSYTKGFGNVNLSFQKGLIKNNKLSLGVTVFDMFNTLYNYTEYNSLQLYSYTNSTWSSRYVSFRLNYNFGKMRKRKLSEIQDNERMKDPNAR